MSTISKLKMEETEWKNPQSNLFMVSSIRRLLAMSGRKEMLLTMRNSISSSPRNRIGLLEGV